MRFFALFAVLALAVSAFAIQTPMEKFLNNSFEPDQSVQVRPVLAQGNYVLVSVDGKEIYVADNSTGKIVADNQQLVGLLVADLKNKSSFNSKVAQAIAFPEAVKGAKSKLEADCMRLTGTDMHECKDKDSCVLACMSNPNCMNVLYSDGFWESVLQWTTDRKKFDSLISTYSEGLGAIATDSATVDAKLPIVDEMSSLSASISGNSIFLNRTDEGCSGANASKRCYEYCPKVNYSAARIADEKANLNELKSAYAVIAGQQQRADSILNQSAENDKYLATRAGLFQELRVRMQNKIAMLENSRLSLAQKVNDTAIPGMIASLSNVSGKIVADGNAGLYRKALAGKSNYEAKEKEVSDRIAADLGAYVGLNDGLASLKAKAENASWLIGNQSASKYVSLADGIKSGLKTPASLAEISAAKADVDVLSTKLADEVSAKAMQGGAKPAGGGGAPAAGGDVNVPNNSGGSGATGGFRLPCMPALAMLLVGAFVFLRRS